MKTIVTAAILASVLFGGASAVHAQALSTQVSGVDLQVTGAVSVQGGAYRDLETQTDETASEWDASVILNGEYVASNGVLWGAQAEFDTGNRRAEDLSRDEVYVYAAGRFGRVELGEQDGPADTVSYHAPTVGLGQIRGDFVRYTGERALLSPFDTRDDLKIIYLSPPVAGLRVGASYAPKVESNADEADPRRRTRQDHAVELAAAYQRPVGNWVLSASGAYVFAKADPITEREDINSWSVGVEAVRGPLTVGGAYVVRGDSNSRIADIDEDEGNAGAAWRGDDWGVAASASITESTRNTNRLIGVGGYYEIGDHWTIRADVVSIEEKSRSGATRDATVGILEASFSF